MAKYDVSFKVGEEGSEDVIKQLEKIQKYIGALTKGTNTVKVGADIDTSGIEQASKETESYRQQVTSLGDAFQGLGSVMMGSGNLLQQFASFFGSDIIGTATRTITSYATVLASNGLSKSIDRYDTMTTFPKMMSMMGYDAEQATEAVNTLNDAVLGLPTSLSDIVEQAQTFTTLTGDLDKGVQYAIAANNTFLAGGADTSQVYYGTKQLQDLISSGELKTMEWQSLIKAMGPAWREIGKEMGYTEDELIDFRSSLIAGDIDGNEFLDAMVRAATGTGALAEMAGLSKEKISSALENIQTAFASTGQAIIQTLDESFQEVEGITLAEKIQEIGSAIKTDLKPYLVKFVQDNFPKIESFIDKLEGYDWMTMIQRVAEWAGMLFDIYSTVLTKIPSTVVAFGMTWASPVGKLLSGIGSFIYGLGNTSLLKGISLGSTSKSLASVGEFVGGLGNVALKLVNAAGAVAVLAELGLVIKEYTGVMESISEMKIGGNFKKNLNNLVAFMGVSGGFTTGVVGVMSALTKSGLGGVVGVGELLSAGLVGVIALTGKVIKEYVDILNEIGSLNLNSNRLKKNLQVIADSMVEMQVIMGVNGLIAFVGGLSELIGAGITTIDMTAMDRIIDTIVKIAEIDDISIDFNSLKQNVQGIKDVINLLTEDEGFFGAFIKSDITNSLSIASDNASKIFSTWTSIIQSYKDAFVNEDGTLEDYGDIAEQIKKDAQTINEVIDALVGDEGVISSWAKKKITGNMDESTSNLAKVLSAWQSLKNTYAGNYKGAEELTADWKKPLESDDDLVEQIKAEADNISEVINEITKGQTLLESAFDTWETENLSESSVHLAMILETWQSIQTQMAEFEPIDITEKVKSMIDMVTSLVEYASGVRTIGEGPISMKTGTDIFSMLGNLINGNAENGSLTSMDEAVRWLRDIVKHYAEMQTAVQGMDLDPAVVTDVQTMFKNLGTMLEDFTAPDFTGTAGAIESWQLLLDSIDDIVGQVITIGETITSDGYTAQRNIDTFFVTKMTAFKTRLEEMELEEIPDKITEIKTMFRSLDGVLNYITAMDIESPTENMMSFNNLIENGIKVMLNKLIEVQELLTQLGANGDEIPVVSMLTNMFTGMENALSSDGATGMVAGLQTLSEALDEIQTMLYFIKTNLEGLQGPLEQYQYALENYIAPYTEQVATNLVAINAQMPILLENVNALLEPMETLEGKLLDINDDMVETMGDIEVMYTDYLPTLLTNIYIIKDGITTTVDSILADSLRLRVEIETLKLTLTQFIELALNPLQAKNEEIYTYIEENLLLAIEETRQSIIALNNTIVAFITTLQLLLNKLNEVKRAFDKLTKSVDKCKEAFDRMAESATTAILKFSELTQKANELAAAINSIPSSKTISIEMSGSGASYASTGGLITGHGVIYRAKGGFAPRGTDTVPAMLTPGEFVMNRKAVKTLGPAFLRRLNRGDIAGAMARVSRRYGMTGNYNVSNITNHDNHATVNQYITTNNEQFTYRRASRFVEAF